MRTDNCLFCASTKIGYRNGLLSTKKNGLQIELRLCPKHSHKKRKKRTWNIAKGQLKKLEEDYQNGKQFTEEPCLLCLGSGKLVQGKLVQGKCWWCNGKGIVLAGVSS